MQPKNIVAVLLLSFIGGIPAILFYLGRLWLGLLFTAIIIAATILVFHFGAPPFVKSFSTYIEYVGFGMGLVAVAVGFLFWRSRDENRFCSKWFWALGLSFIVSVIPALLIRTFVYQPFSIQAQSMAPTLVSGDLISISKASYGYSAYSVPFSVVDFDGRFAAGNPNYGDIVTFRHPVNGFDFVKRIVGLPGDSIQIKQGKLSINGDVMRYTEVGEKEFDGSKVLELMEFLPNDTSHNVFDMVDGSVSDNTPLFKVPDGHYFVMGDHRDNSLDSRFDQMGMIPYENLFGRLQTVVLRGQ